MQRTIWGSQEQGVNALLCVCVQCIHRPSPATFYLFPSSSNFRSTLFCLPPTRTQNATILFSIFHLEKSTAFQWPCSPVLCAHFRPIGDNQFLNCNDQYVKSACLSKVFFVVVAQIEFKFVLANRIQLRDE